VEGALDAGPQLGRGTLDALVNDLATRHGSPQSGWRPAVRPARRAALASNAWRAALAQNIAHLGATGNHSCPRGSGAGLAMPDRPSPILLRPMPAHAVVSQREGLEDDAVPGGRAFAASAFIRARTRCSRSRTATFMATQQAAGRAGGPCAAVHPAYRESSSAAWAVQASARMYIDAHLSLDFAVFGACCWL